MSHASTHYVSDVLFEGMLQKGKELLLVDPDPGSGGSQLSERRETRIRRIAALIRVRNSMIGRSSIRKMVHSRRHRQSWGMCTPRHIERRNPERCCQRWTPASDERCCKGTL